jgi:hypothetical protein
VRRVVKTVAGWACITNPCGKDGCGQTPEGGHGVGCPVWHFVVADDDVALVLQVGSGVYPHMSEAPSARDMSLHTAWSIDREDIRFGVRGVECPYVKGGRCFTPYSVVGTAFWARHGVAEAQSEQSAPFWLALEEELRELAAIYRPRRVDLTYERCACCDGMGTVA